MEGAVVKSFLSYFSSIFLLIRGFTSMYVIELRKFRELKYYQAKLLLIFSNYFVLYCHNAHNLAKKGQKLYSWGPNYICVKCEDSSRFRSTWIIVNYIMYIGPFYNDLHASGSSICTVVIIERHKQKSKLLHKKYGI